MVKSLKSGKVVQSFNRSNFANFAIFGELSSVEEEHLFINGIRKDIVFNNFKIKNLKTKIFNHRVKTSGLSELVGGSIFVVYKKSLNEDDLHLKTLVDSWDFENALCCVYGSKIYDFLWLDSFKSRQVIKKESFWGDIIYFVYSGLFSKLFGILKFIK